MHILLVNDEAELIKPLSRALQQEGYQVDVATSVATGYHLATETPYGLLILDRLLPSCSGLELCCQLRSQSSTTPVLSLTTKDTVRDRVLGLDAGGMTISSNPLNCGNCSLGYELCYADRP